MERNFIGNNHEVRVPARIAPAFYYLIEAETYAAQTQVDRWDFAIEIEFLYELGLVPNDFRWLVRKGFVEHRLEMTPECEDGRSFRTTGDLQFPKGTCFVLTSEGLRAARQVCPIAKNSELDRHVPATVGTTPVSAVAEQKFLQTQNVCPHWDCERRILTYSGRMVKQFKWSAENQESILCAFQEEGWPCKIDDPLKPCPEQNPKRRLSDTIKCLNRKHTNRLIHFRGDGTGEGVIWEVVQDERLPLPECTGTVRQTQFRARLESSAGMSYTNFESNRAVGPA